MRNIDSKSELRTQFRFKQLAVWILLLRSSGSVRTFVTTSTHQRHSAAQRPVLTSPRPLRCASLGWYVAVSLGGSHETTRVHRPSWQRCGCLAACRARAAGRAHAARRGVDDRAPCCGVCGVFFVRSVNCGGFCFCRPAGAFPAPVRHPRRPGRATEIIVAKKHHILRMIGVSILSVCFKRAG